MSLSRTQAAAARGDQQAAAALATMRCPWSSKRSMRQRLPPGPLPPSRQGALLRGNVGAARSSTLISLLRMKEPRNVRSSFTVRDHRGYRAIGPANRVIRSNANTSP